MERYIWMGLFVIDVIYVVPVLVSELISLLLWRRIMRFEKRVDALPGERYFTVFITPTMAFIGGLGGGHATSMIGESLGATFIGVLTAGTLVYTVMRNQYREATGRRPRPVPRARWRQQAAELAHLLSGDPALTGPERVRLRRRAIALGAIGSRITGAAQARSWRGAFGAEPRRRQVVIVTSVALPIFLAAWSAISFDVSNRPVPAYELMLILSLAGAAAPVLRWVDTRRTLLALGQELAEKSRSLVQQSSRMLPRPRPPRVRPPTVPRHTARRRVRSM
ncbi:hypothetical protein [Streptomyces sp. NPDC055099]